MTRRHLALLSLIVSAHAAYADDAVRVEGYFCDTRQDQIAFLTMRATGENEIMSADAVNKSAGRQTCAPYMSVEVVPGNERTMIDGGVVFKIQSFTFLPEKSEKWSGTFFGSLDIVAEKEL